MCMDTHYMFIRLLDIFIVDETYNPDNIHAAHAISSLDVWILYRYRLGSRELYSLNSFELDTIQCNYPNRKNFFLAADFINMAKIHISANPVSTNGETYLFFNIGKKVRPQIEARCSTKTRFSNSIFMGVQVASS